jgi:uncharacterized membrane protein
MLKFTRTLFELIILVFALNDLWIHVHQIWLNHFPMGYDKAISLEWHDARTPMLVAIVVVLIVVVVEAFFVLAEVKEQKRRDAIQLAHAKKDGVTEADIQEQEELLNAKSKKK